MKAAVASGSIWPIWCSMREKTDSRFPKTTPSGKSRTRIWDIPGMNLRVWFSRPSIPAYRWVLSIQCSEKCKFLRRVSVWHQRGANEMRTRRALRS